MVKKKSKKKGNPMNSWSRFHNETIIAYLKRILNYKRIQLLIAFLSLLLTAIGMIYQFIGPSKAEKLIADINENNNKIETTINHDNYIIENDSSEYANLLRNYQHDMLSYVSLWKAVSSNGDIQKSIELPIEEIVNIVISEMEMRKKMGDVVRKIFQDIMDIRTYEYLTDSASVTLLSEIKQKDILNILDTKNLNDSLRKEKVVSNIREATNNKIANLNYKKPLEKALYYLDEMKKDVEWLELHDKISYFTLEANSLFSISYKKYANKEPYAFIKKVIKEKYRNNTKEQEDSILTSFLEEIKTK